EDAVEIDVDDALPIIEIDFACGRLRAADAGVVDGVVQLAERLHGEGDSFFIVFGGGAVGNERSGFAFGAGDFVDHALGGAAIDVGDDNFDAEPGKLLGDGLADAGAAAGDESDFVFERHGRAPLLWVRWVK